LSIIHQNFEIHFLVKVFRKKIDFFAETFQNLFFSFLFAKTVENRRKIDEDASQELTFTIQLLPSSSNSNSNNDNNNNNNNKNNINHVNTNQGYEEPWDEMILTLVVQKKKEICSQGKKLSLQVSFF
jgi:hypothetical protein